jgi:FdrA protein
MHGREINNERRWITRSRRDGTDEEIHMKFMAFEIRRGAYHDSVILMQLQRALVDLPGVLDAGVVMATPANRALLNQSGLLPEGAESAGADDLLIVVQTESEAEAKEALSQVDILLSQRRVSEERQFNPRSLESAAKMLPDSRWVLISVPGRYAAKVARDALRLDRHVFIYSDNVSVEDEIQLKKEASARRLLVMGPDCGTAIINGVGFGFANHVRRGPIGLVGAAGTGLQAISSKIHQLGSGISHAIGTGGRDLRGDVAGITALQGLDLLQRDPATKVIVLVSKPPDPDVAVQLLSRLRMIGKPVVVQFMGYSPPNLQVDSLYFALNFDMAALNAIEILQGGAGLEEHKEQTPVAQDRRRFLRGLFSGGSLANEALRTLQITLYPLYSNIPLVESQRLPDPHQSQAHTILDLGADEFTVGRLHPMIDHELRIRYLRKEAADPEVAWILMDVVLGEGAHPDPAGVLAPIIAEIKKDHPVEVVIVLVGTDEDPQDLDGQKRRFAEAGALVFEDTQKAIEVIRRRLQIEDGFDTPALPLEILSEPISAINVGLEIFYDHLVAQGASAVHVDWRPPAGGDDEILSILEKMRS